MIKRPSFSLKPSQRNMKVCRLCGISIHGLSHRCVSCENLVRAENHIRNYCEENGIEEPPEHEVMALASCDRFEASQHVVDEIIARECKKIREQRTKDHDFYRGLALEQAQDIWMNAEKYAKED